MNLSPKRARIVAFYFPQLHRIPENDAWWGDGFTDWVNVRKARPLARGHYQPRVPQAGRYYDQSDVEVLRWQAALAREHGVEAFCHFHYWFEGRQLLETPTNLLLTNQDIDIKICLAWANETWSRRWDGREREVLLRQTYETSSEGRARHFEYLRRAFTDPRALTVDGRPLFLIYRPADIPDIAVRLDDLRERAHKLGLPGLHLVAMNSGGTFGPWLRHFDAVADYEPMLTYFTTRRSHLLRRALDRIPPGLRAAARPLTGALLARLDRRLPATLDYDAIWRDIVSRGTTAPIREYRGAFVDWDNTARYGWRALRFAGSSPARFEHWLGRLLDQVSAQPYEHRMVFLTAWNEWAESAYLEPDERFGLAYLEALSRAVAAEAASSL